MSRKQAARKFDIIIWGATGYTGRLVLEHLGENCPASAKIGIAGRNQTKLEGLRTEVIKKTNASFEIVIADARNPTDIDAMVSQCRVLIATVGPFWEHGLPIVEACARLGTHYLDSTGETHFIQKAIAEYHELAEQNQSVIVPSCAFEALLPDLATFIVAEYFAQQGKDLKTAKYSVERFMAAGVSTGTILTLMTALSLDMSIQNAVDLNVNCLVAGDHLTETQANGSKICYYDPSFQSWQSFFLPEKGNLRYVRRSADLLGYAPSFSFFETIAQSNAVMAAITGLGQSLVYSLLKFSWIRDLVSYFVTPGSGPSRAQLERGTFKGTVIGWAQDSKDPVKASISYEKEVGYLGTAAILGQAAMLLAYEPKSLNMPGRVGTFGVRKGGILTGAAAFGRALIPRLQKVGFLFSLETAEEYRESSKTK